MKGVREGAQQWMERSSNDGDEGKAMGGEQEGIKAKGTKRPSGSNQPSTLKHDQAQPSEIHQTLNPETRRNPQDGDFPMKHLMNLKRVRESVAE
jgi:hypothetical protein